MNSGELIEWVGGWGEESYVQLTSRVISGREKDEESTQDMCEKMKGPAPIDITGSFPADDH